jgi:hypothetical protein
LEVVTVSRREREREREEAEMEVGAGLLDAVMEREGRQKSED